ncbi:MAG: hypothetical protein GY745_15720 [Actinomycetia bacterium]|nr:hypothetical protein [Actinomycetes bacterium]MCP3913521.1 hypothetical protein [Actinomycetes bacterium]MCP4086483.1 hypothetical protein [Actinomycetes bacterium]
MVGIARELHAEADAADLSALAAIVAGWSATSDLGPKVLGTLQPWNDMVADGLRRVLGQHPLGQLVPTDDMAYAMAALFLGIEMMSRLDPDDERATSLFGSLAGLATFAAPALDAISNSVSDT